MTTRLCQTGGMIFRKSSVRPPGCQPPARRPFGSRSVLHARRFADADSRAGNRFEARVSFAAEASGFVHRWPRWKQRPAAVLDCPKARRMAPDSIPGVENSAWIPKSAARRPAGPLGISNGCFAGKIPSVPMPACRATVAGRVWLPKFAVRPSFCPLEHSSEIFAHPHAAIPCLIGMLFRLTAEPDGLSGDFSNGFAASPRDCSVRRGSAGSGNHFHHFPLTQVRRGNLQHETNKQTKG